MKGFCLLLRYFITTFAFLWNLSFTSRATLWRLVPRTSHQRTELKRPSPPRAEFNLWKNIKSNGSVINSCTLRYFSLTSHCLSLRVVSSIAIATWISPILFVVTLSLVLMLAALAVLCCCDSFCSSTCTTEHRTETRMMMFFAVENWNWKKFPSILLFSVVFRIAEASSFSNNEFSSFFPHRSIFYSETCCAERWSS